MSERHTARNTLANNLRQFRRARAWSQEAMAHAAGLDRTFIAHVESGSRNISLDNIERIARALDVPLHKLLQLESSAYLHELRDDTASTFFSKNAEYPKNPLINPSQFSAKADLAGYAAAMANGSASEQG